MICICLTADHEFMLECSYCEIACNGLLILYVVLCMDIDWVRVVTGCLGSCSFLNTDLQIFMRIFS